jgi:uncharacterized protein YecE (DUF72 family)
MPGQTHIAAAPLPHVFIGTSGWHYASWRGPFFPKELKKKDYLRYYATQFSTTELNGVFYRTPSLEAVRAWTEQTPDGFVFAWKASKFITHWKRLSGKSRNSLALIEERLRILGPKAGPVLFQLPARFEADRDRLASFLRLLSKRRRYAFEFRHPSWYDDEIVDLLRRHDIALCLSDHRDAPAPWEITARHVYVRGHGPGGAYKDHYPDQTLRAWARHIRAWAREGRTVYVYFDNDQKSAAPLDARRLLEILTRTARRQPVRARAFRAPRRSPAAAPAKPRARLRRSRRKRQAASSSRRA